MWSLIQWSISTYVRICTSTCHQWNNLTLIIIDSVENNCSNSDKSNGENNGGNNYGGKNDSGSRNNVGDNKSTKI